MIEDILKTHPPELTAILILETTSTVRGGTLHCRWLCCLKNCWGCP
jgi:hypothetical protein